MRAALFFPQEFRDLIASLELIACLGFKVYRDLGIPQGPRIPELICNDKSCTPLPDKP